MRSYGIYKVKKMYQPFVIGREQLLYNLLTKNLEQGEDLKEIHYLCDIIEKQTVHDVIALKLRKLFTTMEYENGKYTLTHPVKGSIYITLSDYSMNVYCDGSRMLDLDLFVALSESGNRFFAVMDGHEEWGWLKPIKYMQQATEKEELMFR
ncbi:sporulation inhibitor of replication protein SirA [Sporosarcina sp. G11-34]|uniref:sporulation inhibitor of replication protein SirA n=1 Tax=Sporosarcina sp. G11-34 TaxID=2849605 RepID=UPI0022A944E6|nr:sporulation inhibitor of replication protein SirA [Sporosarcina sp. G11-34]MCZ2259562.1 sporulation inhibitor of replication protein SirA [Sporosarcina sp. G11-34]